MRSILFLLLNFLYLNINLLYAQNFNKITEDTKVIEQASYIFEGRVISTNAYADAEEKVLYFSSTVIIDTTIRGNILKKEVIVFYQGPSISKVSGQKKGVYGIYENDSSIYNSALPKNTTVIFLCRNPITNLIDNKDNNYLKLEMIGLALNDYSRGINSTVGIFFDKKSFYKYLNDVTNTKH